MFQQAYHDVERLATRCTQERFHVGSYRVIYEIADTIRIVTVLDIGHRRDVYR